MKYYLIAGEASGDLHAANLMRAIRECDPQAEFRFWGGDAMQQVGGTLVRHYREMAYMGFVQVALHLRQVLKNITLCKNDLAAYRPDVLILVDYPGFNLKIARYAKEQLHLKNHLKEVRMAANLSQAQLAEMVGVSRNTISSIETGQFNPTAKLALILCIALDKKFEELFYF